MLKKLISGGDAGVERAALDVGLAMGMEIGGWYSPVLYIKGDNPPSHYPLELIETDCHASNRNCLDAADGLLILTDGGLHKELNWITKYAEQTGKPWLRVDVGCGIDPVIFCRWIEDHALSTLYITGTSERRQPGLYGATVRYLSFLLGCL